MQRMTLKVLFGACLAGALEISNAVQAQTLSGAALVVALRHGGYVLVMCRAPPSSDVPDTAMAGSAVGRERQLDEMGRRTTQSMIRAIEVLGLPIEDVVSAPGRLALETAPIGGLGPKTEGELVDGVKKAHAIGAADADWLRTEVNKVADPGSDRLIVTRLPTVRASFPSLSGDLADGDTLVFRPGVNGDAGLVARIRINDWPSLVGGA